ncbi:SapC [Bacterioplanes sanyensis]|uniref:SapC family protein n=1 Tax=Bacterioplanes sanyensis TaxID=1249553 RepID=UPI00167B8EF0|nr:SapC family protein [Bacterioplanes sanyensis]GGY55337.1 SapC [Bacterioplanes sanyensis]
MSNYQMLDRNQHKQCGIGPANVLFAAQQSMVPVSRQELHQVLPVMPMAFYPLLEDETPSLVALQSLQPGNNWFVSPDGRWMGAYRPAAYRTHPFRLARDQQRDGLVLCVDDESPAFRHHVGAEDKPLFDESGEPSEFTKNVVEFLRQVESDRQMTRALVLQLEEMDLLVPWKLMAQAESGRKDTIFPGLLHVDESALRQLPGDKLELLSKSGALMLAQAQLMSEHRLDSLQRLHQLHLRIREQVKKTDNLDLDQLFGDDDDGNLSF